MERSEIQQLLARHERFDNLDQAHQGILAENAAVIEVTVGQVLARQGETADRFFLLIDAELSIEVPALTGPRLEIAKLKPGQLFGWSWLIEPYRWHFQATCVRAGTLLDFDGVAILRQCEADPRFGYALLKRFSALMAERLEAAQRRMMDQWSPPGFA